MRIGFDANVLTKEKSAGAYYLGQLVRGLVKCNPRLEIFLFSADKVCVDYDHYIHFPQVTRVTLDLPREARKGWPGKYIPALLKKHRIDVFHSPCQDGAALFHPGCPTVVTVMGLGDWIMAGSFPGWWEKKGYQFRHLAWSRLAARTITLSETTRRDLMRFCRVSGESIAVTFPGAGSDELFSLSQGEAEAVVGQYGLAGQDYIINASGLSDKRHNLNFVLEGFAQYLRHAAGDVKLVVTGSVNYEGAYARAVRKMEMLGIKDKVILTGFISDRSFYALLRNAGAAIVSSMYSGMSFALTECFAAGVPVIASDRGAFPEIAGEAAIMVDMYDIGSLAESLRRLLENQVEHDLYVEKGVTRVKEFSWERMAQETLAVYQGIVKE
ncbi:MAG: glycosyltransferase family 4 protein [Candidatus Omnitrophica bacterium]|nr:glycosyltransferase family 4 protein [Candidatus Omnitrophota bacterium]